MGDKISSRKGRGPAAGVESVPGTLEPIQSIDEIVAFGEQHGWPVAVSRRPSAGAARASGRARRRRRRGPFESATREATAYFGRPEAYMERYLTRPRDIEMQVFCDTHGNVARLGERDCSTQRRHQKLEESPAPGRRRHPRCDGRGRGQGRARPRLPERRNRRDALPGRRLLVPRDEHAFQVEHCVTEMVTQLDLVAEQLRVADGEPLSFTQDSIADRGHSIECRINAENPATGFMPSPGTITRMRIPAGPGVRWDGGYDEGDVVSQTTTTSSASSSSGVSIATWHGRAWCARCTSSRSSGSTRPSRPTSR